MTRPAGPGRIFCSPDGEIVRVIRVGRTGAVTVVVIGGANDGYTFRMPAGMPATWSEYPS